jgi:hypothetical protein
MEPRTSERKRRVVALAIGAILLSANAPSFAKAASEGGSGTNAGGGPEAYSYFMDWARSNVNALKRARMNAGAALLKGKTDAAKRILVSGMQKALEETKRQRPSSEQSLTFRVIQRGLDLAGAIDAISRDGREVFGAQSLITFISFYYDFIIYTAESVDVPYYLAHEREMAKARKHLEPNDKYSDAYAAYAAKQLDFLLANMVEQSGGNNTSDPDHLLRSDVRLLHHFSPASYLKSAELLVGFAFDDLMSSLLSPMYADVMEDLEQLKNDLANFNLQQACPWDDDASLAIKSSYFQMKSLTQKIKAKIKNTAFLGQYNTKENENVSR